MMMVLKFLEPLGRPAGLPLLPLGNCVCFGGLPRPAFCSEPLIFARFLAMSHLLGAFAFQTFKIEFGFHMYRLEAVRLVESADNGVDVWASISIPKPRRPVFSAAIRVVPLPAKESSMIPPRLEQSKIASATS